MKTIGRASLNFKKLIFLAFSLIMSFIIFGCGDISTDAYVYKKAEYVYIHLSMNKSIESSAVVAESSTRTILPEEIDLSDSTKYNFYIWGKSNSGTLSPRKVKFDSTSSTTGTIELDFPVTTYTFVLAATVGTPSDTSEGSKILKEAIMVGYTNADLAYTNTVKFYLSQKEISGSGNVRISMLLDDSWTSEDISDLAEFYFTAGLYDVKTGDEAFEYSSQYFSAPTKTDAVTYSRSSVSAGTYNFTVKIFKTGSTMTYYYSDRLIVSSNSDTVSTIYIPNIVEKIPDAPSEFKVAYTLDSKLYENAIGDEDGYTNYGLLLSWKDNSINEAYFRITLVNVSKTSTEISTLAAPEGFTDSDWNTLVSGYSSNSSVVKVYDDTYTRSDEYFAGSPEKNNTSLILYIPFDYCYVAKIEAVNDAGVSSACYATISEDFSVTVYDEECITDTRTYDGKAFRTNENSSCNVINLYRIIYYLNGGEYYYPTDYGTGSVIETNTIVHYGTYGTTKAFLCPVSTKASATKENPSLIYNGAGIFEEGVPSAGSYWQRWCKSFYFGTDLINIVGGTEEDSETGYPYQKPNDYTGYTSLYLFARYDYD